jgi:DNA-binding transcriptional MerR regulator
MPDNNALLPIGELARRAGAAPSALRYYERIGLLPPAERAGGKRHYPPSSAERVALIRLYQDAGFTLKEIRQLLAAGSRRRASWTPLAERKIAELDARIAEAQNAQRDCSHTLSAAHTATSSPAPTSAPRSKPVSKRPHKQLVDSGLLLAG